mmetsp:Transcript_18278/g.47778  ORF Transcript_18278/g.47778 Transcript_18278/m.47778 type:complete len:553 (-) Transcript_18278:224-1882(-)|eukprot:CAMPEP_0182928396 /NCGR_PEP_ID=MMETSP0105_2-20130417/15564_1 /TAXON_ID=81532 ORGANISM="Acanthoeca-like sp., Strain 10tr" /NCGR_SAMPLE_ID=MMETSP0105_2 /ASSEMBLY_ACC=CAM_ASM_000205 /LENGTH=552 /DNA_ID=CAMNT_0025066399 /DNA_START=185 /DNA_END=1843 /DNA_ORIENTATION=+
MGCGASKTPVGASLQRRTSGATQRGGEADAQYAALSSPAVAAVLASDASPLTSDVEETLSFDAQTGTQLVWPDGAPLNDANKSARTQWQRSRSRLLRAARRIGAARAALGTAPRHVLLIYNPISGGGKSKALVDALVVPIFRLAGVDFTLVRTEFQGFCTKFIKTLGPDACDCIAIAGGDGLLLEAIAGYMQHPDPKAMLARAPVASIPTGTANAMAHTLHSAEELDYCHMVGCATLGAALGHTRLVDVFRISDNGAKLPMYALSCFGWGMAAIITEKAEHLRKTVPKSIRYDVATALCVMKQWPVSVVADLSFRDAPGGEWHTRDNFVVGNFLATNMRKLGHNHAIHSKVAVDDGRAGVVYTLPTARKVDLWRSNKAMKTGHALSDAKGWHAAVYSEFKLKVPDRNSHNSCIMLDGDPSPFCGDELHLKVLPKALPIHSLPWSLAVDAHPGSGGALAEIEQIVGWLRLSAASKSDRVNGDGGKTGGVAAGPAIGVVVPPLPPPSSPPPPPRSPGAAAQEVLSRRTEKGLGKVPNCPDGIKIVSRPLLPQLV